MECILLICTPQNYLIEKDKLIKAKGKLIDEIRGVNYLQVDVPDKFRIGHTKKEFQLMIISSLYFNNKEITN
jgi:hypothetical protein